MHLRGIASHVLPRPSLMQVIATKRGCVAACLPSLPPFVPTHLPASSQASMGGMRTGAAALGRGMEKLRELNLSSCDVSAEALDALATSVSWDCQLQRLRLDYNPLGEDAAPILARLLPSLPHLHSLSLRGCGLHDRGTPHFCSPSMRLPTLQHLISLYVPAHLKFSGPLRISLKPAQL